MSHWQVCGLSHFCPEFFIHISGLWRYYPSDIGLFTIGTVALFPSLWSTCSFNEHGQSFCFFSVVVVVVLNWFIHTQALIFIANMKYIYMYIIHTYVCSYIIMYISSHTWLIYIGYKCPQTCLSWDCLDAVALLPRDCDE